ncbi:Membrane protein involved in the export of O-antigen and teichoic acid [Anaerovirgula multivorans]|uniref:Membrane protein involved in the export of O-antigen and teichoic acid n=1 Tax=Anaerovirgula multivorans TaxID=312168 RepID=A0A239EGD9_9FIRM|nr:oligosaccharide flippase family protein [Anaerovirgula multivorans]SNS43619.1 Membrane protein involved in the export of O-antigen and teichoic acid [Anaerovirgula multivorans]
MSKRTKLFIENFLVYGLGQAISKIIPFLMLPIITRLIPDTYYYGINDVLNVVVSFGSALVIMGLYDALFRMFFDKDELEYKKEVCSSALFSILISGGIVFLILSIFINFFEQLFFDTQQYPILIFIVAVDIYIKALKTIIAAPTRMENKRRTYLIINVISPIIGYSLSIPLLLKGYYLLALPLSSMLSSIITLIIFYSINRTWFQFKFINREIIYALLKIGLPLVPTFIFYWIFSSFDRIMISKLIGIEQVGIYSIGAKVASISQLVYTAFSGGWSYFTFSTMKDEDHVELISKVYEYLGIIAFSSTILLMPFSKIIFELLFTGEYIKGYIVFPYLFLSPLILMLFQTAGSQFLVIKKSWPISASLLLGVMVNIILNYILIPRFGIVGASVATLLGYICSASILTLVLIKMKLLKIKSRFLVPISGISIYFVFFNILRLNSDFIFRFISSLLVIAVYILLYLQDFKNISRIKEYRY